jgi:HK97 family phage portal protein
MGLKQRVAAWLAGEKRETFYPISATGWFTGTTQSGQCVTPERAVGVAAVHACTQFLAETISTLPLGVYRRLPGGDREIDTEHPLYPVLHDRANRVQTAQELREMLVASVALQGNAYAMKVLGNDGAVQELVPMHPDDTTVEQLQNGRLRYKWTRNGRTVTLTQDEVLHVRYRSRDGYTGLSPITIARETIGVAIAQQEHEGAFYRNGLQTSAVLTAPGSISNESASTVKDRLTSEFTGSNKFKLPVLGDGVAFQQISMSHEDAQFIEARRLTIEDIARIFRIPPPAIGDLSRATYSNISELSRWLVTYTLRSWLVRFEQAMNASLLSEDQKRSHFIEHTADALLRGDTRERYESYKIGIENGWLSPNEVRRFENLGAVEGGDTFARGGE